jgi:acylphosphatase
VEVIAAGSAEGLERFDDQLRSGPAMARVDLVEVRLLAPSADHPADDGEFVILP